MAAISDPSGTRRYRLSTGVRVAFTSTSSSAEELPAVSSSREVLITASARCFIRIGSDAVTAASGTDADVLPIEANEKFHMKIGSADTKFTVIRDTADGVLRVYACD